MSATQLAARRGVAPARWAGRRHTRNARPRRLAASKGGDPSSALSSLESLDCMLGSDEGQAQQQQLQQAQQEQQQERAAATMSSLDSILGSRDEGQAQQQQQQQQQQQELWPSSTLSSLDSILDSRDEEPEPQQQQPASQLLQLLRVPYWTWQELREPRVTPVWSNVLYYLLLLVYAAYYVIALADGQEAADDTLACLAADSGAVASGDTLRLATAFFVSPSLPALIVGLVGLATVSTELESLLGPPVFWAIWTLSTLTGSLAGVALGGEPITAGPAPGVGGMAAALLAHHLVNWRLEQQLLRCHANDVPASLLALERQYHQQQLAAVRGAAGEPAAAGAAAAAGDRAAAQQQQQQQQGEEADDVLVETLVEGPVGMSFSLWLPQEGKAFLTLGGTAISVFSALRDAAVSDTGTDWWALGAAFGTGALLGALACPVYRVELVPASTNDSSSSSSGVGSGSEAPPPDLLLPVVRDTRPPAARANAVVGCAAALFAALGVWLVQQGAFVG